MARKGSKRNGYDVISYNHIMSCHIIFDNLIIVKKYTCMLHRSYLGGASTMISSSYSWADFDTLPKKKKPNLESPWFTGFLSLKKKEAGSSPWPTIFFVTQGVTNRVCHLDSSPIYQASRQRPIYAFCEWYSWGWIVRKRVGVKKCW